VTTNSAKVAAVDPPREVCGGGNRQERTSVVGEARSVVKSCRLGGLGGESEACLGGIVEPPRGTESQAGINGRLAVPARGRRRSHPGEQDQGEIGARPDSIEEGLQGADVVGARWNVGSLIGANQRKSHGL